MHITKIINESGDIASNLTEIRKLDNLDQISKLLKAYKLLKLTQKDKISDPFYI